MKVERQLGGYAKMTIENIDAKNLSLPPDKTKLEIIALLDTIEREWVLKQIKRFIINISK